MILTSRLMGDRAQTNSIVELLWLKAPHFSRKKRSATVRPAEQVTACLFVATVVYLLLVLRSTSGATDSVPNLAVTGGTALVLLCLGAVQSLRDRFFCVQISDDCPDRRLLVHP